MLSRGLTPAGEGMRPRVLLPGGELGGWAGLGGWGPGGYDRAAGWKG